MTRVLADIREAPTPKRRRVSVSAVRDTVKALLETGHAVDKVCISGGEVEITCHSVENHEAPENDGGLKEW